MLAYDAHQVRAAEEPLLAAGPEGELMQRAAFGLAVVVARELRERCGHVRGATVVGLVGPGNNGGDTLYALALLAGRGARVLAVLVDRRAHAAGLAAVRAASGRVATLGGPIGPERMWLGDVLAEAYSADVVLDGVLGIGARGAVTGSAGDLVRLFGSLLEEDVRDGTRNGAPLVVAVDVPSGVGVDDGTLPGGRASTDVLRADLTVAFGAAKPCLLLPPAAAVAGRLEIVDIGLAPGTAGAPGLDRPSVVRLAAADVAALWPVPDAAAQKYTRGVLGLVAGTGAYPGAAVLAASGAVLSGVGMLRYLGPEVAARAVLAARPEVVVGDGKVQAWAVGSGVDPGHVPATDPTAEQVERIRHVLARAVAHSVPTVADAGALALLPAKLPPWVVLTPHAGELARLLTSLLHDVGPLPGGSWPDGSAGGGGEVSRAQVEAEPLRWARLAHELTGATVLLKGEVTVVVGPHGSVYAQADGPAWLATAGAGDVLTGILGTLLAARSAEVVEDPTLAAALAAAATLVHGRAAHRANPGGPVSALAVANAIPGIVAEILG